MAGSRNPGLLTGSHNTAGDGVDLGFASVLKVDIDAGKAIRCVFADSLYLKDLLLFVKVHAKGSGDIDRLTDELTAEGPGIRVFHDVSQRHLQGAGQGTCGDVREHLVPDHLLHPVGDIGSKTAG